jgi:hydrogenase expression/formation protein HypC
MCLAVPGRILTVAGDDPLQRVGRVSFGGVVKEVNLVCVPDAQPGDYVIVHVGLALSTVDPEEAERTLEYFREMGELAELDERPAPAQDAAQPQSGAP